MNEQADYDMPAAVDYVYKQNNNQKIYIINSSYSNMISWFALASPPEESFYVDRVEKVIATSPVAGDGM